MIAVVVEMVPGVCMCRWPLCDCRLAREMCVDRCEDVSLEELEEDYVLNRMLMDV